jgi:hypothetical protein
VELARRSSVATTSPSPRPLHSCPGTLEHHDADVRDRQQLAHPAAAQVHDVTPAGAPPLEAGRERRSGSTANALPTSRSARARSTTPSQADDAHGDQRRPVHAREADRGDHLLGTGLTRGVRRVMGLLASNTPGS